MKEVEDYLELMFMKADINSTIDFRQGMPGVKSNNYSHLNMIRDSNSSLKSN